MDDGAPKEEQHSEGEQADLADVEALQGQKSFVPALPQAPIAGSWLDSMREWDNSRERPPGGETYWSRGDASQFQLRQGPCYSKRGLKAASAPSLYDCHRVAAIRAAVPVSEVMGRLLPVPQVGSQLWTPCCQLPRTISIVVKLPYTTKDASNSDPGCSIVAVFGITDDAVREATSSTPSAAVQLMANFVRQAGGSCGDASRLSSGVVKGIAIGENISELGLSMIPAALVNRYNATPTLVTKSGTCFKGPEGEWLEIDVDVRNWCFAARKALVNLRGCLPKATLHIGACIQGVDDSELPERIFCACRIHNLDLDETPVAVKDPRAPQ